LARLLHDHDVVAAVRVKILCNVTSALSAELQNLQLNFERPYCSSQHWGKWQRNHFTFRISLADTLHRAFKFRKKGFSMPRMG